MFISERDDFIRLDPGAARVDDAETIAVAVAGETEGQMLLLDLFRKAGGGLRRRLGRTR